MMKPSQYELTNINNPERPYTYVAKCADNPDGKTMAVVLSVSGLVEGGNPRAACELLCKAMAEVSAKLQGDVIVEVEVEPPINNVGPFATIEEAIAGGVPPHVFTEDKSGAVDEIKASQPSADWPVGDTFGRPGPV
jgi:hypothetical protein